MKYLIKNINDIDSLSIKNFLKKCKDCDLSYINKIKNLKKRKQTIVGKILLANLLKKEYNINYFDIEINYNYNGKPFFNNLNIFFNISHSYDMVICVISNSKIGVDIEKIVDINPKFTNIFLTTSEKEYVNYPAKNYNKRFFQIYTLKESYIKAMGNSILKNSNISFAYKNNTLTCSNKLILFKTIESVENYIISICWIKA